MFRAIVVGCDGFDRGRQAVAWAAMLADAADARLVRLEELPTYRLSHGLAGFLAGIGCWPQGVPVPDDLPGPPGV
jgi:hypothetical protein